MWLALSLLTAFFTATAAAFLKFAIRNNDEVVVGWLRYIICLPIFLLLLVFVPKPHIGIEFWKCVVVLLPLELTAFLLYLKSIKISPLSLTFPFLGLTPVFSILTSRVLIGETISFGGITGIALVTIGAYLLNADRIRYGWAEPIKNIYKEKGSFLMVIVAVIYSITAILGKKAVLLTTPYFFPLFYYTLLAAVYTLVLFVLPGHKINKIRLNKKELLMLLLSSAAFSATVMLHFKAISMIQASYMISVKRMSLLFGIIYGAILFGEKNIKYRFLGALMMIVGVAVLAM